MIFMVHCNMRRSLRTLNYGWQFEYITIPYETPAPFSLSSGYHPPSNWLVPSSYYRLSCTSVGEDQLQCICLEFSIHYIFIHNRILVQDMARHVSNSFVFPKLRFVHCRHPHKCERWGMKGISCPAQLLCCGFLHHLLLLLLLHIDKFFFLNRLLLPGLHKCGRWMVDNVIMG